MAKKSVVENEAYKVYFDQFFGFISATYKIDQSSWDELCKIAVCWQVDKNVSLLSQNKVESAVRFLGKGAVKCVDQHNGQSFVYDFRVAPIVLSETVSLINNTPSCIALETVTKCELIEFPREAFLKIMYQRMDVAKFGIAGIANYLGMMHYKHALLRTLSAEERYKQFLQEFPTVALEVKLEDIASYLGVTQPSLSRIRKNLTWKENEKSLEALSNELEVLHGRR